MFGSRRPSALVPTGPTRYQSRHAPGSFMLRSRRMRPGPRTGYPRGLVTAPSSRVGEPLSARLRVSEPALKDPAEAARQLPRPASSEEIAVGLVVIAPAGMLETEPGALRSRRKLERHHRVAEPAGPPAGQPPLRLHFEDLSLYPAERLAALQCELPPDLGDEVVGHEPQR